MAPALANILLMGDPVLLGLSLRLSWYRIHLLRGRPMFHPWVGKIPWRRERLPTSVFWPEEFYDIVHGVTKSWTWLSMCVHTHTHTHTHTPVKPSPHAWHESIQALQKFSHILCQFLPSTPPHIAHSQATSDQLSVAIDYFAFSRILYKWNHKVCTLLWLLSFSTINLKVIYVVWINSSFLFIAVIPLYKHMTKYLSINLLVETWVVFSFWLLQIKLLWALCTSLCLLLFLFS